VGRFFRNGALEQEVLQSYRSADMVVLVIIERACVEVGGLPAQDWPLRVTLVYRREGAEWRRIGMPTRLVNGVCLEQAAALARGAVWDLTEPQVTAQGHGLRFSAAFSALGDRSSPRPVAIHASSPRPRHAVFRQNASVRLGTLASTQTKTLRFSPRNRWG
jgi:hypothetical protein